jgi:hypothetical protein
MKSIKVIKSIMSQSQDKALVKFNFLVTFFLYYSTKKIFKKGLCKCPKMNLKLYNSVFETRKDTIDFWAVSSLHEKEMTKYLVSKKEKGTFIDVGTHIGRYSVLMAKKGWNVHSFEPVKATLNQLKKKHFKK